MSEYLHRPSTATRFNAGPGFRELVADYEDSRDSEARALMELDADSAATMRAIDFAYDVELIGMLFDSVDPDIRKKIWRGRLERDGFDAGQRVMALRIICLSSILPIICFELGQRSGSPSGYPPLAIRLMNIVFEVFDRTVAIEQNQAHYNTGKIQSADEVPGFCFGAFADAANSTSILLAAKGEEPSEALSANLEVFETAEFAATFGQFLAGLSGMPVRPSPHWSFRREVIMYSQSLQQAFFDAKARCYRFCVDELPEARRALSEGDSTRQGKIAEDLRILSQKAQWFAEAAGAS